MLLALQTLKNRKEFLAVRGGARASVQVCLLEARQRKSGCVQYEGPRFGFTITKKLGNAVTRNRIRRRLKAALTELECECAAPGFDYVVVARLAALDRPFAELLGDLRRALEVVHNPAAGKGAAKSRKGGESPAGTRETAKKTSRP